MANEIFLCRPDHIFRNINRIQDHLRIIFENKFREVAFPDADLEHLGMSSCKRFFYLKRRNNSQCHICGAKINDGLVALP